MGAADIVPGVSGGTVALILGIYSRLVGAISRVDVAAIKLLRRGEWRALATHLDILFLVSLLTGIAIGIGSLASLMHYLLEEQTQHTYAAFFGLILASTVLVARMVSDWTKQLLIGFSVGAIGAFFVVGLPLLQSPPEGNIYIFAAGAIAICAMILPGISGSFILLILGKYTVITGLLREFLRGEASLATVTTLATFCLGCAFGLIGFTKFLRWLLASYERMTMAVLCGFMLGSLRRIWPFRAPVALQGDTKPGDLPDAILPMHWDGDVWLSLAIAVGAFLFVLILDRIANARAQQLVRLTDQ